MKRVLALAVAVLCAGLVIGQKLPVGNVPSSGSVRKTRSNKHFVVDDDEPTPHVIRKSSHAMSQLNGTSILVPNDPGVSYDPQKPEQVHLFEALGELDQAIHQGPTGWRQIIIVIIDSGGIPHPDLDGNRLISEDVDFVGGVVTDDHGAAVNSIADALTNNSLGSYGLAGFTRTVTVVHMRIFDNDGDATFEDELAAFDAVIAKKKKGLPIYVVNCSFGGPGISQAERNKLKELTDTGDGILVFAATAPNTPGAGCDFTPACLYLSNPRIIPVGGLNLTGDGPLRNSTWGSILAPTDVRVAVNPNDPNDLSGFGGTSSATGGTSGAAALAMSVHPEFTVDMVRDQMIVSGEPVPGTSFKRVNLYNMITKRPLLVGQDGNPNDAVALDGVNGKPGPFPVTSSYWNTKTNQLETMETRVAFDAYNVDSLSAPQAIIVELKDTNGNVRAALPAESLLRRSDLPFVTRITIALPGSLAGAGTLKATLKYNGSESDPLKIEIR